MSRTQYSPVEVRPERGGRLVTRASLENVGLFDYSAKREMRRDLDAEIQREGHDYFWPSVGGSGPGNQPLPLESGDTGPVNLIHEVVRENGHRAIIVGTPTRLYRFNTMDRGGVYEAGVFEDDIYAESAADWIVIGRGFSADAHRWEALNIGGYIWLNNGRDLPVTYRVQDQEVVPVYELREQGISHVGTIAELNGVPFAMDISSIQTALLNTLFEHDGIRLSEGIFGSASGTSVEAAGEFFTADDVGRQIVFDDGTSALITAVTSATLVQVDSTISAHPQPFRLRTLLYQEGSIWSGAITADQPLNGQIVTADDPIFTANMIGATIRFVNGWTSVITGFTSSTVITVQDAAPADIDDLPFWVVSDAVSSSWSVKKLPNPDTGLIHDFAIQGAIGQDPWWHVGAGYAGAASDMELFNATTNKTHSVRLRGVVGEEWLEIDAGVALIGDAPVVYAENTDTGFGHELTTDGLIIAIGTPLGATGGDYIVEASAPLFTADHVGRLLFWDTGDSRRIEAYLSPTQVLVDSDLSHSQEIGAIENLTSYAKWDGAVDRVTYRCLWGSTFDNPRRWGVIAEGSANAGENRISLRYPFKSFTSEQNVTIVGGGALNGNLSTDVLYVTDNQVLLTADQIGTDVENGIVEQTDVIGSIVGYEDLQHGGTGIHRALPLKGRLIIYKDSAIFVASYTGNVERPFDFDRIEIPDGKNLYYRWSLVSVNNEFHLFAGKMSFFRFDLVSVIPREFDSAELCKNVFYGQAKLENTNRIFAAKNEVTNEVWFWFDSQVTDKALIFDYLYGTWSTSARAMSAAATVKRPVEGGILAGESQNWFLMATDGVIVVYGLAAEAVESWEGAKSISYMRSSNPLDPYRAGYNWLLRSGLSDFGMRHSEKDIRSYVLHLASDSDSYPITFDLLGARNAKELLTLKQLTIEDPGAEPLLSLFYRRHYFGWSLSGNSDGGVIKITGQTLEVSGVNSRSFVRRVA